MSEICCNKSIENFIYLKSVNLLSFNSSFIKMDTKRKFLFLSVKQFLWRKEKIRRMRFYPLLSNYLKWKIELQRTEISLLSLSLFLNSTTGKVKHGIWQLKGQELWFDEMWQKRSNNSYQKYWKTDFRMTRKTFKKLVNLVSPNLSKEDTKFRKSIPVRKRVATALWRLSTGNSFSTIAKTFAVKKLTAVSIKKDFWKEMSRLSKEYIKFPVTSDEVENAIEKFKTCCNYQLW